MNWLSLALGAFGALSSLVLLDEFVVRRMGARRLIGLDPRPCVDIVCTTSLDTTSKWGSSSAKRALTPEGELFGVMATANALGRWYPRSEMTIQNSERRSRTYDRDLILIGGPDGNGCTAEVFRWDELSSLIRIDATTSTLVLPGFSVNGYKHDFVSGRPTRDLGLIVITRNRWSPEGEARLLVFAGLTTYGTGAAAEFFFGHIGKRRRAFPSALRKALRSDPFVYIVVEASFSNGYLSGSRLAKWGRLPHLPDLSPDLSSLEL